jgi:hypothetical protein
LTLHELAEDFRKGESEAFNGLVTMSEAEEQDWIQLWAKADSTVLLDFLHGCGRSMSIERLDELAGLSNNFSEFMHIVDMCRGEV